MQPSSTSSAIRPSQLHVINAVLNHPTASSHEDTGKPERRRQMTARYRTTIGRRCFSRHHPSHHFYHVTFSTTCQCIAIVLLVSTFKSTLGFESCNLCADGSTITKPDHLLGITSPYMRNTSKDLIDALLIIRSEELLCDRSRFYAAHCGCPVLLDPCTLCSDGSSITKPDKVIYVYGDGQFMDTCQDFNDRFLVIPNDSRTCNGAGSAYGVECGCPIFGDPCTMCKGGALMDKHDKEVVATLGVKAIHTYF